MFLFEVASFRSHIINYTQIAVYTPNYIRGHYSSNNAHFQAYSHYSSCLIFFIKYNNKFPWFLFTQVKATLLAYNFWLVKQLLQASIIFTCLSQRVYNKNSQYELMLEMLDTKQKINSCLMRIVFMYIYAFHVCVKKRHILTLNWQADQIGSQDILYIYK